MGLCTNLTTRPKEGLAPGLTASMLRAAGCSSLPVGFTSMIIDPPEVDLDD